MARKYITKDTLKKNTLADIFIFILNKKQTTRREIEYETGFSWGTVSETVALLIEKGYIEETKSKQSGVAGRTTYVLSPASKNVVSMGLDINRSGLFCQVVALNSQVISTHHAPFTARTQSQVIKQAEELCRRVIGECHDKNLKIFSLGIAMQGTVDGKNGLSIRFPGIADWQTCNIREHFSKQLHLPVYLGHDPSCMLLGEMHKETYGDCVLLRIDEGIGMAVSLNGKILDDTDRFELGHTVIHPDGRLSGNECCGRLEACASLSAVSEAGDDKAYTEGLIKAGEYLSLALYNVYVLFKPQRLILTGKATTLPVFVESATAIIKNEPVEISVSPEISAAYGAAIEAARAAVKAFEI